MKNKKSKLKVIRFLMLILVSLSTAHAASSSAGGGAAFEDVAEKASHVLTQLELIDGFANLGHGWALSLKIDWLAKGYGYDQNPEAAKQFIEDLVGQQNDVAINHKILGLGYGMFGYDRDPEAARDFTDQMAQQGSEVAAMKKIDGLTYGQFGYDRDPEAAKQLIEDLVDQRKDFAIG